MNFLVDRTPPQVRVIDDNFSDVANNAITDTGGMLVSGTDLMPDGVTPGSGVAKISLKQTAGGTYHEAKTFNPSVTQESVNFPLAGGALPSGDYLANVIDAVGNTSTTTFHIPPRLSLMFALDNSNSFQYSFTGAASSVINTWASQMGLGFESGVSVAVTKDGAAFASGNALSLALSGLTDGFYTVTATGVGGLTTRVSFRRYTFTATVDTSKPAAALAGGAFQFSPNIQVVDTFPGTNNVTVQVFAVVLDPNGINYNKVGSALTSCSGTGSLTCPIPPQPAGTFAIEATDVNGAITQSFQFRTDFGSVVDYFDPVRAAFANTELATSPTGANGVALAVVRTGSNAGKQYVSSGTATTGIESLLGNSMDHGLAISAAPGAIGAALIAPSLSGFDLVHLPLGATTPEQAGYTGLSATWALSAGPDPGALPAFVPISQTKARVLGDLALQQADMIIENTPLATFPLDLGAYTRWQVTLTPNTVTSGPFAAGAVSPIIDRVAFLPQLAVANVLQGTGTMFEQTSPTGLCRVSATAPNLTVAEVAVQPPNGLNSVGLGCKVDPTLIFTTTAAVKLNFSTSALIAAGLDINSVVAYVQPPKGQFTRVPFQMVDRTSGVATAFVGSLVLDSTFALFAATAPPAGSGGGGVTPSTAPAHLTVVGVASTTVDLSWSANGNPSGVDYILFYGTAAGAAQCGASLTNSFPMTTTTTFEASGLNPGTTYQLEVCASGGAGLCATPLQVVTAPAGQGPLSQFQTFACGGSGGGGGPGGGGGTGAGVGRGLAIAADAGGKLWEVVDDGGKIELARYGPSGVEVSTLLAGADDSDGQWTLRFDKSGGVYAIGMAAGAGGAKDPAVFRMRQADGSLISSATFHAGDGVKTSVWDSNGDLWITGLVQGGTSQAPSATMGLWKYSIATGQVTRTASFGAAATPAAGFGVTALDGAVYVVGYTSTQPLTTPALSAALWKFDGLGHGPIAGPFTEPSGLLTSVSNGVNAKVEVASGTLYAAAQRTDAFGVNDLDFIRFDAGGNILSDHYGVAPGSFSLLPAAMAQDAQGNLLVAVSASGPQGGGYGVATFARDGGLLGVTASSNGQGAVYGMAPLGGKLWLAVDGSTAPVLYVGDQPIPATDVVVSSGPVDSMPPVTRLLASALGEVTSSATLMIGTTFTLVATDPPDASGLSSGVAETLYWVDLDPFACNADFDPTQPAGTCANPAYSAPYQLAAGTHTVFFQSTDAAGNSEEMQARALTIVVDTIPPVTTFRVDGPLYVGAASATFVSPASTLTLTAVDPSPNASGVARTELSLDSEPFAAVAAPFRLREGAHSLRYRSIDNAGNVEATHAVSLQVDATPPLTQLALAGGRQFPGPDAQTFYASSDTRFAFSAADPVSSGVASGVAFTRRQDNGGTFALFSLSFTLAEGAHALTYQSQDNVGNLEVLRSTNVRIDATAPVTTSSFGAPYFQAFDGTNYVSSTTPLGFMAADPQLPSGQPGSGVGRIEVSVDSAPFAVYAASVTFAEGRHVVLYRSIDNVGNVEATKTLALRSDATPPVSALSIGLPQFAYSSSTLLVSGRTPFSLAAADPVVNGVASGVKQSFYSINGAGSTAFTSSFTLSGTDGWRTIQFYSQDNVSNTEVARSSAVLLLATPPAISLLCPAPSPSGVCHVFKGKFQVLGSVADAYLLDYVLDVAAGQNANSGFATVSSATVNVSSAALGTWDASGLSGWQTLRLTATDLVGNAASVSVNVFIGDPGELMILGGHDDLSRPSAVAIGQDGKIYIADTNRDRIVVFSAGGSFLQAIGGPEGGRNRPQTIKLSRPQGVFTDVFGNIFVADTEAGRVLKLSQQAQVLQTITGLRKPMGVAVDASGDIFVAEAGDHSIKKLTPTGSTLLSFKLPALPRERDDEDKDDEKEDRERGLGRPAALALDAAGNIYVADVAGARALKFDPKGSLLLTIPIAERRENKPRPGRPRGIAVDAAGHCLLVSDERFDRVLRFDALGSQDLAFGASRRDGEEDRNRIEPSGIFFKKPAGVALDGQGNVFVADRLDDVVASFGLPTGAPPITGTTRPPSLWRAASTDTVSGWIDLGAGGKILRQDLAGVVLPPGALSSSMTITVSGFRIRSELEEAVKQRKIDGQGLLAVSTSVVIGPDATRLRAPATIVVPYDQNQVLAQGLSEMGLQVFWWNPDRQDWQWQPSTVDTFHHTVSAQVMRFSLFQVLGRRPKQAPTISAAQR